MIYTLDFSKKAEKQFCKLDRSAQENISAYIKKYFGVTPHDPRSHGKPLTGKLKGYWRYEVGKYRLICEIQDNICKVIVVKAGHRRDIYK
ncbi:MAG: type II toxin-antitoxin system RelE/ParE family toxin [Defluviitaleaceae bacterium]|nr:type II toxin-antitoxin system RelE/ParE family toxin [Defluviitaleaceae bacterium]